MQDFDIAPLTHVEESRMRWFRKLALAAFASLALTTGNASATAEVSNADPACTVTASFVDDVAVVSVACPQDASVEVWATQIDGSLSLVASAAAGGSSSFSIVVPMEVSPAIGGGLLVITMLDGRDIRDWLE